MVDIAATLIHWYAENKRELPWRETTDPYRIWISEIILQQTRVVQGLEYFNRFMLRFPDVRALAEAPGDEVMKYWQGLGYYSRARNLHAAAKEIVEKFGGEFPRNYSDVLTLKGIGEYTAAAICSFAWKLPYAVVDGNVYRVLARISVSIPLSTVTREESVFRVGCRTARPASSGPLQSGDYGFRSHTMYAESPRLFILSVTGKLCGTGFRPS